MKKALNIKTIAF